MLTKNHRCMYTHAPVVLQKCVSWLAKTQLGRSTYVRIPVTAAFRKQNTFFLLEANDPPQFISLFLYSFFWRW